MKTIQSILLASSLTLSLGVSVQAQAATALQPNTLSAHDRELLFEQDGQPMQFALLSEQEMKETKGARWPFVTNWVTRIFWGGNLGVYLGGRERADNPYTHSMMGTPRLYGEYIGMYSVLGLISTNPFIGFVSSVIGYNHQKYGGIEGLRRTMRDNNWNLRDLTQHVGEAVDQAAAVGTFDRVEPYTGESSPSGHVSFLVGLTSQLPEIELRQFFSSLPDSSLNQLLTRVAPDTDRDQFLSDLAPETVNQVLIAMPDRYMRDFVRIVPDRIMNPIFNSSPALRAYWSG